MVSDLLEKLLVKVAKFYPSSGSSYIGLPVPQQQNRFLLKNTNTRDQNSFVCCFIAAHHLQFGLSHTESDNVAPTSKEMKKSTTTELSGLRRWLYIIQLGFFSDQTCGHPLE